LVSDRAAWRASAGIFESLTDAGFVCKRLIYDDMRYARVEQVREVEALAGDVEGILSVGSGSVNDICRVAAFRLNKEFAIFGTAPSMDGFASDTAPIIENNFKSTWQAKQPEIILADTEILARAPAELKAAGFGDMVAKYIGVLEWRFVHMLVDEYYCPAIADMTMDAVRKMISLCDRVQGEDPEAAGAIMEALVLSGLAMKLAKSSRPASGAEHTVSHYLECYKLTRGIWPEFHGKKVGVATVHINRMYHRLAQVKEITPTEDVIDYEALRAAFTPGQMAEVERLIERMPMHLVKPDRLREIWPRFCREIETFLPSDAELIDWMRRAGAVTEWEDVGVSRELLCAALRYHPFMRYRLMPTRLLPMMGLDILDFVD
jgi:glycerol-1-phosphate dehydrogenase [NAD(P)+]